MASASLSKYRQKRDFSKTTEPAGATGDDAGNRFVIHKHAAPPITTIFASSSTAC
jgi:bifunctional non-homologous end joining protein LigD